MKPTDEQIVAQAHDQVAGTEIDIGGDVSRSEGGLGAYVSAWIWVDFADIEDKDIEESEKEGA